MTSSTIRFYFDYESPNAYLAWTQLPQLADRYGVAIDPLPVLYAGLLEAHGQLGPGEIAAKGRWMSKNIARKATLLGVPLKPPAFMPFNPLLALRMSLLPLEASRLRALGGDPEPHLARAPRVGQDAHHRRPHDRRRERRLEAHLSRDVGLADAHPAGEGGDRIASHGRLARQHGQQAVDAEPE